MDLALMEGPSQRRAGIIGLKPDSTPAETQARLNSFEALTRWHMLEHRKRKLDLYTARSTLQALLKENTAPDHNQVEYLEWDIHEAEEDVKAHLHGARRFYDLWKELQWAVQERDEESAKKAENREENLSAETEEMDFEKGVENGEMFDGSKDSTSAEMELFDVDDELCEMFKASSVSCG